MKNNTTPTVDAMEQIAFIGNIIPHTWYRHITGADGKGPDLLAITILADICAWYKPRIERSELTGEPLAKTKRFAGHKLQKSYGALAQQYGYSKDHIRRTINKLEDLGLIRKEVVTSVPLPSGAVINNVLYIEPIPDAIAAISYLGAKPLPAPTPTPDPDPYALGSTDPMVFHDQTYTDTTTLTTLLTITDVCGAANADAPRAQDNVSDDLSKEPVYDENKITRETYENEIGRIVNTLAYGMPYCAEDPDLPPRYLEQAPITVDVATPVQPCLELDLGGFNQQEMRSKLQPGARASAPAKGKGKVKTPRAPKPKVEYVGVHADIDYEDLLARARSVGADTRHNRKQQSVDAIDAMVDDGATPDDIVALHAYCLTDPWVIENCVPVTPGFCKNRYQPWVRAGRPAKFTKGGKSNGSYKPSNRAVDPNNDLWD